MLAGVTLNHPGSKVGAIVVKAEEKLPFGRAMKIIKKGSAM